jgi:hypothetical protein
MCALVGLYWKFLCLCYLSCHLKMKGDMEKLTIYSSVVNAVETHCNVKKVRILP